MCRSVSTNCLRSGSVTALSPILLPFHSRRIRVLHFEPIWRAAGAVGGILALRDDALKPHLARVGEDGRAVALYVFVEPDAGASPGKHAHERGFSDLKRIAPQVIAVLLDEIEGVQERAVIMAAIANEIE
jgi:hypothetical protein